MKIYSLLLCFSLTNDGSQKEFGTEGFVLTSAFSRNVASRCWRKTPYRAFRASNSDSASASSAPVSIRTWPQRDCTSEIQRDDTVATREHKPIQPPMIKERAYGSHHAVGVGEEVGGIVDRRRIVDELLVGV